MTSNPATSVAQRVAEIPVQRRARAEDQGQRAGPELVDQVLAVRAERLGQRGRRPHAAHQDRGRHVAAAPLGGEQRGDRGRGEGVGADAVDGIGGQHDELALLDGAGGRDQAVLPLLRVGAVVSSAH